MPFGRVAFEVACRAQVPLVSLAVRCEPVYLSKQVPPLRPPHPMPRLEVELLDVWEPDEETTSRTLRARTERRYTDIFKQFANDKSNS